MFTQGLYIRDLYKSTWLTVQLLRGFNVLASLKICCGFMVYCLHTMAAVASLNRFCRHPSIILSSFHKMLQYCKTLKGIYHENIVIL